MFGRTVYLSFSFILAVGRYTRRYGRVSFRYKVSLRNARGEVRYLLGESAYAARWVGGDSLAPFALLWLYRMGKSK